MNYFRITSTCLVASLTCLCGCASYSVKPDVASITVPRTSPPIPVKAGITSTEQKLSGGFPDITQELYKQLDQSALFQELYYPVRPTDSFDGAITLQINASFKMDPAWFPKAFFTGLFMFLPAPITTYHHQYQAECTLNVIRDGKTLKTYTGHGTVVASHKLLAPAEKLEAEGTAAATKALAADLISQLINDRSFLEKELAAPKMPAS